MIHPNNLVLKLSLQVELFRAFAKDRTDVRLLVVGARYTRDYEIQYVEEVKRAINGDPRIELYDVTENVDRFYEVFVDEESQD